MTNKEIANSFRTLAAIMELHGENQFKIRSYSNAYITLRKWEQPLVEMTTDEIAAIKGVGKAIQGKIQELLTEGEMATLKKYQDQTPEGIQEMLQIKGFGPKKISVIWKDMGIETVGELLYACNENRLIELKGFGQKTQTDLKNKLEYFLQSQGKFHFATLEKPALELIEQLKTQLPNAKITLTGAIRRCAPILDQIELLIASNESISNIFETDLLQLQEEHHNYFQAQTATDLPVRIYTCSLTEYGSKLFRYTAHPDFLTAFIEAFPAIDFKNIAEETTIFDKVQLPFLAPELRESEYGVNLLQSNQIPKLIEEKEIKGVLHTHTTYSDGLHTLDDMCTYAKELDYEYIGITDHSKSAFYANGLKEDRLLEQFAAIDALNDKLDNFTVFKGIESDILNDGSLDYPEDILKQFDFIIASVHSNLRMDKTKATARLIAAIENPYTKILGHPTGRLLLSREGYPLDHLKVIDACAANGVAIELNANPYRLDLDWTWIPYALEKGVLIAINPDAHSKEGIHDIHFGTLAARKGGLTKEACLNSLNKEEFAAWLRK